MSFFGSDWKDNGEEDIGPIVPSSWKEDSDNPNDIPQPSVYQLLDNMSSGQRIELFHKYCWGCGYKHESCICDDEEY